MITVIIPLYNKENSISVCIKSLHDQINTDFKVLIIDDGSTDKSSEIAKNSMSDKISYIRKENGGVSSARNLGILLSNTDFICFLDADDFWDCDYIESIYSLIRLFPEGDMFGMAYKIIFEDKETVPKFPIPVRFRGIIYNYFSLANSNTLFWSSAICIRKKVFTKVGIFDERIHLGEDLDLWFRIILGGGIPVFWNEPKSNYNKNPENNPGTLYKKLEHTLFYYLMDKNEDSYKSNLEYRKFVNNFILKGLIRQLLLKKDIHLIKEIVSKIKPVNYFQKASKILFKIW